MKYRYQVVCYDVKGYIIKFENFEEQHHEQLKWLVDNWINQKPNVNKIEITRWNERGERE